MRCVNGLKFSSTQTRSDTEVDYSMRKEVYVNLPHWSLVTERAGIGLCVATSS